MDTDPGHIEFPTTCHPNTLAIYAYWLDRRCGRQMPRREDIDPTAIPRKTLPGICLVDVVPDNRRYVYRLVGTGEVEVRGYDPTGESVIDGFFGPSAADALACYDRVVSTRAPFLDATPFTSPGGRYVTMETLFLPLSEDGINVTKILVFSHSESVVRFVTAPRVS
jgi:hypothetical protein